MLKFYTFLIISLLITSCTTEPPDPVKVEAESKKINDYFDRMFDEYVDRSPMLQTRLGIKKDYDKWSDISPERDDFELEQSKKSLKWLKDSVDVKLLDESTRLSYDLYLQGIKDQINDDKYRLYSYPLNQMFGMQSEIPAFLINMHRVSNLDDAEAYVARLEGVKALFDQLIENMRNREEAGIIAPKFVFDHVLFDSRNVISGYPFSGEDSSAIFKDFYGKVQSLKASSADKKRLISDAVKALNSSVKPAYEALIAMVEDLSEKYDEEDGVWRLKNGSRFYQTALNRTTTTTMTSDQIHELGLKEVERIHGEMEVIKDKVGFEGTLQEFFKEMKENEKFYYPNTAAGKKAYIDEAVKMIDDMKLELDALFITKPKADMIVKAVESFREKSAGKAFYQRPAPDGSRPGIYYANMYDMKMMPKYQMEALAYHEGIPGHHMQLAIAQELTGIPKFRKFGGYTAYIEGWGLYSEYLPKELGFYSDPYSDFGRLAMELWRSCRLVVDTGIHSKKWTREEGIEYYETNTPNDRLDCVKMVERHIVMPGQATAYKVGMNYLLDLRESTEKRLGPDFDIREFHEAILYNGPVPLSQLDIQVGAITGK